MLKLHSLPYDLLLNIAQYLDLHDVHALQLVSPHLIAAKVLQKLGSEVALDHLEYGSFVQSPECLALTHGSNHNTELITDQKIYYRRARRCVILRPLGLFSESSHTLYYADAVPSLWRVFSGYQTSAQNN